jgi:hypothetical protein
MHWLSLDPGIIRLGFAAGCVSQSATGKTQARVKASGRLSIAEDKDKGARWNTAKLIARIDEVVAMLPAEVNKTTCRCFVENQFVSSNRIVQVFGALKLHLESVHGFTVENVNASQKAAHFNFRKKEGVNPYYQRKKESLRCAREWIAAQEQGDVPVEVADAFRKGRKGQINGCDSYLFDQADALTQAIAIIEKNPPKTSLERQRRCRAGQRDRKAKEKAAKSKDKDKDKDKHKHKDKDKHKHKAPSDADVMDLTGDDAALTAQTAPQSGAVAVAVVVDLT